MKQISIILLLITFGLGTSAQKVEVYSYSGSGASTTLHIQTKKLEEKGSYYYNDYWQTGEIILISGDVIKDYPFKYDIKKNIIEIKVDDIIKVLSIGRVKEIIWVDKKGKIEVLRNTMLYENYSGTGFFSILYEGKKSFLKKTFLKIIDPNYVNALDVGEQDKKIVKRDLYFVAEGNQVFSIKKKRKQILKQLGEKADNVKNYADENNLNFKDDNNIVKIFNYYNNL